MWLGNTGEMKLLGLVKLRAGFLFFLLILMCHPLFENNENAS